MMLTVLLFLCSITVIASVPVEPSEDVTCETILKGADLLYSAEEAMSCPTQSKVKNEDCHLLSQEQLQPCLINSDETCVGKAIESLLPTPECPDLATVCHALENNRKSLEETTSLVCETEPRPRFIFGLLKRFLGPFIQRFLQGRK